MQATNNFINGPLLNRVKVCYQPVFFKSAVCELTAIGSIIEFLHGGHVTWQEQ